MKKIIIMLGFVMTILLSCCSCTERHNSLDEYKEFIVRSGIGYSDVEIDHPTYFLPSLTFLHDFDYKEGNYYYYDPGLKDSIVYKNNKPHKTLIVLKYEEPEYQKAKQFMLKEIPPYRRKYYVYGNYNFYINSNFMKSFDYTLPAPTFPRWVTMAYYNDNSYILGFIGMYIDINALEDKYLNDIENNWASFIDEYYGEYYDFSK